MTGSRIETTSAGKRLLYVIYAGDEYDQAIEAALVEHGIDQDRDPELQVIAMTERLASLFKITGMSRRTGDAGGRVVGKQRRLL